MNAIYDSIQVDASTSAPIYVTPVRTDLGTNLFDLNNYNNLIETAGIPYYGQYGSTGNERLGTSVQLSNWIHGEQNFSTGTYMNMEHQAESHAFQAQGEKVNDDHEFQSKLKGKTAESHRRKIISERLEALQKVVPSSLKVNRKSLQGNQESILDNAIGHIKYLQLQLKELSGSRLRGESISAPLVFLEGHGHYHRREQMLEEPLEEVIGSLIEENPIAAWKLLESKGLYIMPMASIDALRAAE